MREHRKPPPNTLLSDARCRSLSPSGSGRPMSRQELADAVNSYVWQTYKIAERLDENDIGKLERGEHRWPGEKRREAFRAVLGAGTDAELGFYIIRGMSSMAGAGRESSTSHQPSDAATASAATRPRRAAETSDSHSAEGGGQVRQLRGFAHTADDITQSWDIIDADQQDPDLFDLWELNQILRGGRMGAEELGLAEAACVRLDQRYAELPPHAVLPKISVQLRMTVRALHESQPVAHRRRLCSLAGRLAGLRAWLLFDLANHHAADAWYDAAIQAAREAEDYALCGWLFGARSLIPSYRHDHRAAVILIEQGQSAADRSGDATVRTWLHALEARARAGVGDPTGSRTAQRRADRLVTRTDPAYRRHGMDFDSDKLDLTYYAGTSHLLLHQPDAAAEFLQESLDNLPAAHTKAHAILLLGIATAAVQKQRIEEATDLACQALTVAGDQPIMPILQRAHDLRNQLAASPAGALTAVDEHLEEFTDRLRTRSAELPP